MKPKPKPAYRRMTWTDRLIIEKLYNKGSSYRVIAEMTGFAVSSVYREIQHGLYEHMGAETSRRPFHYSAQMAHDYSKFQATSKGPGLKLDHNHGHAKHVASQIAKGHSPDQITGALRKSNGWTVSTTTLYRWAIFPMSQTRTFPKNRTASASTALSKRPARPKAPA